MAKRHKRVSILALPFAVLVWSVGWIFCWVDSRKQDPKPTLRHLRK